MPEVAVLVQGLVALVLSVTLEVMAELVFIRAAAVPQVLMVTMSLEVLLVGAEVA